MKHFQFAAITCLLAIAVSGCSIIAKPVQFDFYQIIASQTALPGETLDAQIGVAELRTGEPLSTDQMALRFSGNRFGVHAGVRWEARAPRMLQGLMVRSMIDSERLPGASRIGSDVRAQYLVVGELRRFEADYSSQPATVEVDISVQLIEVGPNRVIANHRFRASEIISGSGAGGITASFQKASDSVLAEYVQWTIESIPTNITP